MPVSARLLPPAVMAPPRLGRNTIRALLWLGAVCAVLLGWRHGIAALASPYDFLARSAGVQMSESLLPFASSDSLGRMLMAGMANTVAVSLLACAGALVLGCVAGVAATAAHPLVRAYAALYINVLRNIPLLLQVLAWYALILKLPDVRASLDLGAGITLSHRGLRMPALVTEASTQSRWIASVLVLAMAAILYRLARPRSTRLVPGKLRALRGAVLVCTAMMIAHLWIAGLEMPVRGRYNYAGGVTVSPECCALVLSLALYAGAYIGDILRGSLRAVPAGQWEAGRALGLPAWRLLWNIVLPQAWLAALPAVTNQFINVVKNSSLAIAIGFPDLLWAVTTTINVTGRSVEAVLLMLSLYLLPSLAGAVLLERINRRNLYRQRRS